MRTLVGLCLLAMLAVSSAVDIDTTRPRRTTKPAKGAKLVPAVVFKGHWLPKHRVIIVPKGDPRAYPPGLAPIRPQTQAPAVPAQPGSPARPVLQATPDNRCPSAGGVCKDVSTCSLATNTVVSGLCQGGNNIKCCVPKRASPPANPPANPPAPSSCKYSGCASTVRKGNSRSYDTCALQASDLTEPGKANWNDRDADVYIEKTIACKWDALRAAAAAAGVRLTISSAFRSYARQQYFWMCYKTKSCNSGNVAAQPGTSNHGNAIALDLNTDCGKQPGSKTPSACKNSKVYMWLYANGTKFGFTRTVRSEPWHWEYRPGTPLPSFAHF